MSARRNPMGSPCVQYRLYICHGAGEDRTETIHRRGTGDILLTGC
jgi:hypothetical protein